MALKSFRKLIIERIRLLPFLAPWLALGLTSCISATGPILGDARARADLGPSFGPDLTGAEVRYLMSKEWARFPDDILWRRSKLGLTMPAANREALAAFMTQA